MTLFQKLPQELPLGRFRLIARLGRGGMAEVFLARLIGAGGFEKLVAIKRMLPDVSSNPTFVAMFLEEGRIAAQLDHPNICHVYELGEGDGTLYMAMELLRGLSWSDIVPAIPDRPHQAAVRFIIGFAIQACEGLHHAHTVIGADGQTHPIVHRDVSPANLFVTNEGVVKLLDFGVSKVTTSATLTPNGMLKGKLPYMSPEQVRGRAVDPRADVFSLAVVIWEALAGRALFDRASDYGTMMAVAEASVPPLPGDAPVIAPLDAVLRRALARDRAQRPGSARELAHELRRAIAAYGEPMVASEIEAHLAQWVGSSLQRRNKDLAQILGRRPMPAAAGDEVTGERTVPHATRPAAGARLRAVSIVVRDVVREVVPASDGETVESFTTEAPTVNARTTEFAAQDGGHDTVVAPPITHEMLAMLASGPQMIAIPPSGAQDALAAAAITHEMRAMLPSGPQDMTAIPPSGPQDTLVDAPPVRSDVATPHAASVTENAQTRPRAQPVYPIALHIASPRPVAPLVQAGPAGRGSHAARIDRTGSPRGRALPIVPIVAIAAIVAGVIAALLLV